MPNESTTPSVPPASDAPVSEDTSGTEPDGSRGGGEGGTATRTRPTRPRLDRLPPWKVLLHNDDQSDMLFVVDSIVVLGVANRQEAITRMLEAHETGCALLMTTHQERAELIQEQFRSKSLVVTIEPA